MKFVKVTKIGDKIENKGITFPDVDENFMANSKKLIGVIQMSLKAIKIYLTKPRQIFVKLSEMDLLHWMPDEEYLHLIWPRHSIGYALNLTEPKSFNEKLQWLKLHNRNPFYATLVDKYAVKKYVSKTIGEKYVIPLVDGPWESADKINFDVLPNQFVLKCNHDSGGIIICKDKSKLDIDAARKMLNKRLKHNYYWDSREWSYKNVQPCVFAEKYMVDDSGYELKDYKFFCFGGMPKVVEVDYGRFVNHRRNLYDTEWNYLDYAIMYPTDPKHVVEKPPCLNEMLECAAKLSAGIPFVRVDFYVVDGNPLFGEMTFYHDGGRGAFSPKEWDYKLGDWIQLP